MSVFAHSREQGGPGEQAWRFTHPSLMTVAANGLMNFPEAKDLEVSIQFLIFFKRWQLTWSF